MLEETPDRLVLRSTSPLFALGMIAFALLIGTFGLVDILEEHGENGGWIALPLALLILPLGVLILLCPVQYVINRPEGTLMHLRRGPWEKVLKRHDVTGLQKAIASSYNIRSSAGGKSWKVQLTHLGGTPVTLQTAMGRKRAARLAARLNQWIDT